MLKSSRILGTALFAGLLLMMLSSVRGNAAEPIDNAKLIKMLKADLSGTIVILKLEDSAKSGMCRITASVDDLIELKKAGADPKLLERVIALSKSSEDAARKAVLEMLRWSRNDNPEQLQRAINKAARFGTNALPYILKQGMTSKYPEEIAASIETIGKIGDPSVYSDVWQNLFHNNETVRYKAAKAIVQLTDDPKKLLQSLRDALKKPGRDLDGVIWAMGYLHDSDAEEFLIHLLANSRHANNRAAAAFSLGELGSPSTMGLLRLRDGVLTDSSKKVRLACAAALSRVANESSEVALSLQRAFERYPKDRFYLIMAMAKFQYNSLLVGFLINDVLPGDYAPAVKQAAFEALKQMTDADYQKVDEWRNWWRFAAHREPYIMRKSPAAAPPMKPETPSTPTPKN